MKTKCPECGFEEDWGELPAGFSRVSCSKCGTFISIPKPKPEPEPEPELEPQSFEFEVEGVPVELNWGDGEITINVGDSSGAGLTAYHLQHFLGFTLSREDREPDGDYSELLTVFRDGEVIYKREPRCHFSINRAAKTATWRGFIYPVIMAHILKVLGYVLDFKIISAGTLDDARSNLWRSD